MKILNYNVKTPVFLLCAFFVLSGCATTTKVATVRTTDNDLTCEQIKEQDQQLDAVMEEADDNKDVNTKNVAAAVFFWPALATTVISANKAEKLVEKRRKRLNDLYLKKGCE
jgi:hypothetical protein